MDMQDRHSGNYEEKLQRQQLADKSNQGKSKRFLFVYSFVMFSVALALILLSYFVNNRNSAAIGADGENAGFSVSAMKSIETLKSDNLSLAAENEELKDRIKIMDSEIDDLNNSIDQQSKLVSDITEDSEKHLKQSEALEVLWQIYKLFAQNKYADCRKAIAHMNDSGLVEYLPDECTTSFQSNSPKSEFERISKAVG